MAGLSFNDDVNQFFVNLQPLPVFIGRFRMVRDNFDDGGEFIDPHLPDVQVGDQRITLVLNAFTDHNWQMLWLGFSGWLVGCDRRSRRAYRGTVWLVRTGKYAGELQTNQGKKDQKINSQGPQGGLHHRCRFDARHNSNQLGNSIFAPRMMSR
jgi:hypothetical protein